MAEVAAIVSQVTGRHVDVRHYTPEEAASIGNNPGLTESQQWANVEGYQVDVEKAKGRGIDLERLADWARRMRSRFDID